MESQHSAGAPTCHHFPRSVIISEKAWPEVGSRWRSPTVWGFWKKDPLRANFHKSVPKEFTMSQNHVLCANFVKFGWPVIGKVVRCLPDKKQNFRKPFRSRFCADRAQNLSNTLGVPKISSKSVHFRRSYSRTREHRSNAPQSIFPILGETSSPSNYRCFTKHTLASRRQRALPAATQWSCLLLRVVCSIYDIYKTPSSHLLQFHTTVIRPILEYVLPLWLPTLIKSQAERLEALQRRAINIIFVIPRLPLKFRRSDIPFLQARRLNCSKRFFSETFANPIVVLSIYRLLPPPRDPVETSRLRKPTISFASEDIALQCLMAF